MWRYKWWTADCFQFVVLYHCQVNGQPLRHPQHCNVFKTLHLLTIDFMTGKNPSSSLFPPATNISILVPNLMSITIATSLSIILITESFSFSFLHAKNVWICRCWPEKYISPCVCASWTHRHIYSYNHNHNQCYAACFSLLWQNLYFLTPYTCYESDLHKVDQYECYNEFDGKVQWQNEGDLWAC